MSEQQEADARSAALLARIAGGDGDALAELYDTFAGILFGLIYKVVLDRAEAEDVLQEVFVTVWKKAGSFDVDKGRPVTWLMTMARNRSLNRLRSRNRRSATVETAKNEGALPGTSEQETVAEVLPLPGETSAIVRDALANLPDGQRRAIELAYFGGYTQQQIAKQLDRPIGTVKAWIWRGMASMREHLSPVLKSGEAKNRNR